MNTRGCFMVQSIASGRIFEVSCRLGGREWMDVYSIEPAQHAGGRCASRGTGVASKDSFEQAFLCGVRTPG